MILADRQSKRVFLAADGGQISWSAETAQLNRFFRFAVTRTRGSEANLLISSSAIIDAEEQFLQLLSWDWTHPRKAGHSVF